MGSQFLLEKIGHYAIIAFEFTPKKIAKSKDKSALELGFDFIKTQGPISNMAN